MCAFFEKSGKKCEISINFVLKIIELKNPYMIKNLLFDLGGVIMDIEKNNCIAAFERLGLKDAKSYFGEYSQQGPFEALEEGKISTDEFHEAMRTAIGEHATDADIDHAFNCFLTGIPKHRLAELRELRKKYKIYLLSNTNAIMWNSRIADEFTQEGLTREDYFDGMVTSFEAKALKPGSEIFKYAQQTLGIVPSETLFLDDSHANCEVARLLGWYAEPVEPGTEFMDVLSELDL
jgi:putative hydrolase of the HAD superfamily